MEARLFMTKSNHKNTYIVDISALADTCRKYVYSIPIYLLIPLLKFSLFV